MKIHLLLLVMLLLPLLAHADAVAINGIYYNLVNKSKVAEVTLILKDTRAASKFLNL